MKSDDCLFCRIVRGDIPCEKVYEDEELLAFRDVDPKAPVHILIIPKRHIETINDIGNKDSALTGKMVHAAAVIARKEGIDIKGYRLVFNCNDDGGQAVYHIHLHLLGGRKMTWPPG